MMVGIISIEELSIFLRSLGKRECSVKKDHLGNFSDIEIIFPLELNTVHEMNSESEAEMGFNDSNCFRNMVLLVFAAVDVSAYFLRNGVFGLPKVILDKGWKQDIERTRRRRFMRCLIENHFHYDSITTWCNARTSLCL